MDKVFRISVRNLVEFLLRSGDLDNRRDGFADKEAMQKGSRLHRKIQRRMGGDYRAEQNLVYRREYDRFAIQLEGRADGIFTEGQMTWIDEIKGVYLDVEYLKEPFEVHLAQAKCYACILGMEQKQERMGIQMTYANLESEEIRRFRREYEQRELEQWMEELLKEYHRWADFQYQWELGRNASVEKLHFPFPYRPGQRDLVAGVYRTIQQSRQLFIQAPTGIGKTMSAVYPAVRALGEGLSEKIFYLTAKTITRTVAEEAFLVLQEQGLQIKTLTVTAKEKLCVCEKADCNPESCPRAKGHYDRVNEAVFEFLQTESRMGREEILRQSEKWQVCPYEMCLDTASWVDGIICDYNYVFDPNARLRRFFGEGIRGNYLFLIDEAHNLVERGREMFSAALYKEDFLKLKKAVRPYSRKLERLLEKGNRQLLEYKRECDSCRILESLGAFPISLMNLMGEMEHFLEELNAGNLRDQVLEFYFQVRDFLGIYDLVDENYVIYSRHDEEGDFYIKLFCVNPAGNLQACLDKGTAAVFFSATLLPMPYYQKLLSARGGEDYSMYARSPFAPERRLLLLGGDVSSRYTRRTEEEFRKIAAYISEAVKKRRGNYMVFFPSYRFLQDVQVIYEREFCGEWERCLSQTPSMGEREREEFLEAFAEEGEETVIGFCIMGGIFSEGIDLAGEKLVGAVIVGTGLPQVGAEREILKNYYDRRGENGFDYAYRFPGMNKVLQAAGRVIRTAEDKGILLLLDDRFWNREYQGLFPVEWQDRKRCSLRSAGGQIEDFWNTIEKGEKE